MELKYYLVHEPEATPNALIISLVPRPPVLDRGRASKLIILLVCMLYYIPGMVKYVYYKERYACTCNLSKIDQQHANTVQPH